jgi:hypothetical protein
VIDGDVLGEFVCAGVGRLLAVVKGATSSVSGGHDGE